MVVGILFCIGALKYGFGAFGIPGPGFFPFLTGISLISLSIILSISAISKKQSETISTERFFPERESWKRMLQVLGALCFYVIALKRLGFLITTLVFMIIVLRLEPRKWLFILVAALLSAVFFYLLFQVLLEGQLPGGILG